MFTNLGLVAITRIFSILMVMTSITIIVSAFFVEKHIVVINDTWELYQTDLSEKARLEGALHSAIGYGGVIHGFKNYILRSEEKYKKHAELKIGAAIAILEQYRTLELTTAEVVAIEDILSVLEAYDSAIISTQKMLTQGYNITNIDQNVKIDDQPAIRGLKSLRQEVVSTQNKNHALSKSRLVADLRSALGYGGMIHKFKNHILRHNDVHGDDVKEAMQLNDIKAAIKSAQYAIYQYREISPTEVETLALNDIESTISHYLSNLENIHNLIKQNNDIKNLDQAVKVNDAPALRGLQLLDSEISQQLTVRSTDVSHSLALVGKAISLGKWASIITVLVVMIIAIILIRYAVIQPITRLIQNMSSLAENKLDTEITDHNMHNEIGQMASTVLIFKDNMISQQQSERALAKANQGLEQQLEDNKQLRQQSEEQTNKALLMSEYMIEARNASEEAMARAEKDELFVSSVLNAVRDGIITISAKGIVEIFNPGAEDIFGYKSFEVLGKNISMLMPEPDKSQHDSYLQNFLNGKSNRDQSLIMEQIGQRKNGETFPIAISLNTIKIADEIKITGVIRDVTERKKWEEQIQRLAMTDPLTGLANRHQYEIYLEDAIKHVKRFKMDFALVLLDLDKFKPVNDTYGHPIGDELLKKVAEILLACCREVDKVARLGGDEFAIILYGVNKPEDAVIPAQKIIEQLSTPLLIENHSIQIGASMGISVYPTDSTDMEAIQRMADEALYLSKEEGRNTYRFYKEISE